MDAIGLTIFNDIYTRFLSKLNRFVRTTNINCSINVKSITTKNISNCNIIFSNKCVSNELTTFTLLLQSIGEVLLLLPNDRRESIELRLGLTAEEIVNEEDKGFIHECNVQASVINDINIGDIVLENCASNVPLEFLFLNAGSVDTNCGMRFLSDALINNDTVDPITNHYLTHLFNLSLFDYMTLFIIIFSSFLLFLLVNFYVNNKSKVIYYSRNTILNKHDNVLDNIYLRYNNGKKNLY
jgi:hypothetical protein